MTVLLAHPEYSSVPDKNCTCAGTNYYISSCCEADRDLQGRQRIYGLSGSIKKQGQSGFIIFLVSKIWCFLYYIYNMYILYYIALCNISSEFMYIITETPSKGGISLILQCRNRLKEGKGLV